MSALLYVLVLLLSAYGLSVQAEGCEPAVDMLESNDAVNRMSECDYSDKGLNGWFKARTENTPEPMHTSQTAVLPPVVDPPVLAAKFELISVGVKSALDLVQARFTLVAQAAEHCDGVAVLSEEAYRQGHQGHTQLIMSFYCR
ncbi:hypothetical protein [Gilvimarinus polysaccharolyticus]|uniref:hypothetical protein n=1 Tax=Gilvimarinus polysaccharolyticus TaxID=863921 RepID=UPI0012FB4173|nr:hypothetical protein [Gilvimarinus polysaccharolyticus]